MSAIYLIGSPYDFPDILNLKGQFGFPFRNQKGMSVVCSVLVSQTKFFKSSPTFLGVDGDLVIHILRLVSLIINEC